MPNENEYVVSFIYTDKNGDSQTAKVKVSATSEADAIKKAKEKTSVNEGGNNYQVIPGASVSRK